MEGWSEVVRIPLTDTPPDDPNNPSPSTSASNSSPSQISSITFDHVYNLLWYGSFQGFTRSFTTLSASNSINPYQQSFQLIPYTSFRTSLYKNKVLKNLTHRDGILFLSTNCINFNDRRGLTRFSMSNHDNDLINSLTSLTTNCNSINEVVIGGEKSLFKFDINKPNNITTFNHDGNITSINHLSKFLILGKSNGTIELFDPIGNVSIKEFQAHTGVIFDFDVHDNLIATCGASIRARRYYHNHHGHHGQNSGVNSELTLDPLVNLFDIRTKKSLAPIPFPAGASAVKFVPKLSNTAVIASNSGQLQFVDVFDHTHSTIYQADLLPSSQLQPASHHQFKSPLLQNLEVSDNGDYLAFNDSYSYLHIWSLNNSLSMNKAFVSYPQPLEQPDIIMPPMDGPFGIDDNVPLSIIGMPYYKEQLLSAFPYELTFTKELARIPNKIDHDLLMESEKTKGFIPYDKVKYGPRNIYKKYQSLKDSSNNSHDGKIVPKFISERASTNSKTLRKTDSSTSIDSEAVSNSSEDDSIFQYKSSPANKIPNCYSILQIKYSKFGVRDFDFSFYNKTEHCGLENHINNSYVNSLLQLYRFQPEFHYLILNNLLQEWLPNDFNTILNDNNPQGSSILNELGYLFDMMEKAKGNNVNISNLSQVLSINKDANLRGLINVNECENLDSKGLRNILVDFNNFLINQLNQDFLNQTGKNPLADLMGITFEIQVKSTSKACQVNEKSRGSMFALDLVTPPSNALNKLSILINPNWSNQQPQPANPNTARKNVTLVTYLEYSVNQFKTIPCQQPHPHQFPHNLEIRKSILSFPSLLSINVNLSSEEYKLINSFKQWLIPEFYVFNNNNPNLDTPLAFKQSVTQFDNAKDYLKYDLVGYVCEINHQSEVATGFHNLVTFIKTNGKWYLFNDFLVMPIPESEVFDLSSNWKKPIMLLYNSSEIASNKFEYFHTETFSKIPSLNSTILYRDHFAGTIREGYKKEYELLTQSDAPQFGSLVAIDAEFVNLRPDEVEIRYNGDKKLIKPKFLSLARLSVIRGEDGPLFGKAFIDDYIVHTSEIYDYLTNFSGIEPGDLDPIKSEKNLVTLQTTYRKLWLLLNMGVVFVGHGLYNDFRGINIQVPREQIRDTNEFFYKSSYKRQLSLKFLAYVCLKEKVQTGNHDSIEDAYTALLLYRKYLDLVARGEFEDALHNIYIEGTSLRFKVPE
ncbi:ubiquitin carboxyl-terminal hydrolase-domain-containing protein [Scheffersomyces coipomensis]|uniref:ubiquitin carboxyl-terminal hydrolase-domain-containing protein n=1 Tax=Scheffersomyces coipomensis TaxID=1788519 RepID=UPI00315D0921